MTPPTAKAELLRLRVRLIRRQTLRRIERVTWALVWASVLVYFVTGFLL